MFLSYHSVSMFVKDEMASFDPQKTLYDFIQFVDKICVLGLQVVWWAPIPYYKSDSFVE